MAPLANLFDSFNDGAISSQWSVTSGTWAETGGTLCATVPTQGVLRSTGSYSLVQSSGFVEIASYLNGAGAASGLSVYRLFSSVDPTDWVEFIINASAANITYRRVDNNVVQETLTEAYDATAMRWLRIRSTGGTTYFETAPDGTAWSVQFSAPTQAWASSVRVQFQLEQTGGTPTTKCLDNFNVAPASSRAVAVGSEFDITNDGKLRIERCDKADAAWPFSCSESIYNSLRRSEEPCGLWVQPPAKQYLDVESRVISAIGESDEVTIITLDLVNPDTCRTMAFYLPLVAGIRFFQPTPAEDAGVGDVIYWSLGAQVTGVDNPDDSFTTLVADDFRVPGTNLWRGVSDYYWTAPPGGSTTVTVILKVFKAGGSATLQNFQASLGVLGWSVLAP